MPFGLAEPKQRRKRNLAYDDFNGSALRSEWAKTDTEGKLSVSGGNLVCSGGKATPAWDDPRITWTKPIAAKAGVTFDCEMTFSAFGATGMDFGFDPQTPVTDALRPGFDITSAGVLRIVGATGGAGLTNTPITLSTGVSYRFRIVLRGTQGIAWLYSADGGATWKIVWIDTVAASGSIFAGYSNNSATFTSAYMRVFKGPVVVPILSDAFASRTAPGRADTGQPWLGVSGKAIPTFASNDMRIPSGSTESWLFTPTGVADGVWEADFNFGSAPGATKQGNLSFRWRDLNNHVRAVFNRQAQTITIVRIAAGVLTTLATLSSAGFADNTTYHFRVVAVGASISVYQDGVLKLSVSEAFGQYCAMFGIELFDSLATPDARIDNVAVWGFPRRPLLIDTFDKPDGTYTSPTPDVAGPYSMSSDIGMPNGAVISELIASGRGALSNNAALSAAQHLYGLVAMSSASFVASIIARWDALTGNLGAQGMMVRRQDDQNYLAVYLNSSNNTIAVRKRLAGTYTTISSASFTPVVNTDALITVIFIGNTLEVYINGARFISTTYSDFATPGTAGPFQFTFGNGPMHLDDFRIYPLTSPIGTHDTFTRADSATTMGSTETPGTAWGNSGTWGISSNQGYNISDADNDKASFVFVPNDYSVEALVSGALVAPNLRVPQILLNWDTPNSSRQFYVALDSANVYLIKRDASSVENIQAQAASVSVSGTGYLIHVDVIGSNITVYKDGTKLFSTTLTAQDTLDYLGFNSGRRLVGLRLGKSGAPATNARWDNFTAKEIV